MFGNQDQAINKTLVESATQLGAKIQQISEDAIAATLPIDMKKYDLVQATQLLIRAVPRSQVMRCDETENGIEILIQIG